MTRTSSIPTTATQRLKQDYMRLKRDPVPYVTAEPLHNNVLEWHYVVTGPPDTPYEGGFYHGKLVFPREFPFKPPAIYMITPNGRFKCNQRLCLSISDFHPDTWNPAWSVATILTGLLSFMVEETATLGSVQTSLVTRRSLAFSSKETNLKNEIFVELFPDIVTEMKKQLAKERRSGSRGAAESSESPLEGAGDGGDAAEQQQDDNENNNNNPGEFSTILVFVGVIVLAVCVDNLIKALAS